MKKNLFYTFFVLVLFSFKSSAYDLIVAKDGSGNYTTVQAAINAVPTGLTAAYTIYIKNGRYKEKINIPSNKPFIQLIGESVANTILTYDDYASKMTTCSGTIGTQNSASFTVNAADFAATDITFENSFGDGSQAVAVLVNADRAVFKNCRFLGNQDTVYLKGGGTPKVYFSQCYIDGNVDFIFGNSVALFDSCVIYAKSRTAAGSSFITAPNTPTGQAYGYVFNNCKLPSNTGATSYYLSRPWPSPSEALTAQKVIFINSFLSTHINPAGWVIWNASTITANLTYAEYASKYFDGTLVDVSARVPWSYQLTAPQAATYTIANIFGGWDPCTVAAGICTPVTTPIAVSNFRVTKSASNSQFNWNISWPISGIDYTLYRSTDNSNFSPIYTTTATNDTAVNFQHTDNSIPTSGTEYFYYVSASKSGYVTHNTDTLVVTAKPLLIVNASAGLSLCGVSQTIGTPSAAQQYTISGSNLTNDLIITPPLNFEVSVNNSTWFTNAAPLTISPVAGTIATTIIYIRLNASATGPYSGNVLNASTGAVSINVPVSGVTYGVSTSFLLQAWPMTQNKNDSTAVRSPGVTASTPSFTNLFSTDGSLPAPAGTIPPYSTTFGQAFGSSAAGNNWSAIGGTLKRNFYQEFTVTSAANYTVRVDSITFLANFYLTASSTKMAVVYSKNGFGSPADSTEFSDGVNGVGAALVLTSSGTFTKSFPLTQNNGGPVDYYALALNGNTGVTLAAGQTLTIRLYFACSSTGIPRYAMLKSVFIKGLANSTVLPLKLISFTAVQQKKAVKLLWQTSNEIHTKYFEVEKSFNGVNFTAIGKLNSLNGVSLNNYELMDNGRLSNLVYYRLKITDDNGTIQYSDLQIIKNQAFITLSISPNPVKNQLVINHQKAVAGAYFELVSTDGKILQTCPAGYNNKTTSFSVETYPAGNYYLIFMNGAERQVTNFVK